LTQVKSVIGDTKYSNLRTADPTQRKNDGEPINGVEDPVYYIDYGFKHPLIYFYTPGTETNTNYHNSFDTFEISNLVLSNLTAYPIEEQLPILAKFEGFVTDLTINEITISAVD
jgi:hypothetical protein